MDVRVDTLSALDCERWINSIVVPRPIAWVSTVNPGGTTNLAPFSYFNVVCADPPIVMVSFSSKGKKDSLENARRAGEFAVNLAGHSLRIPMVASAAELGRDEDEAAVLGLPTAPGVTIAAPHLAGAAAVLECTVYDIRTIETSTLLLGRVSQIHVEDEVLRDGRVDSVALAPVARLGGSEYTTVTDVYKIRRPMGDDVTAMLATAVAEPAEN